MTDHFSTLQQERRPGFDPEALKATFRQLGAEAHPDAAGDAARFATLNEAYTVLREPATRIRHLLELEYPEAPPATSIPADLADRFMEVATLKRESDAFVNQQDAATTPLARALLASEGSAQRRDLKKVQASLEREFESALERLQWEDQKWSTRDGETAARLATLQQEFSFLRKWRDELRELVLAHELLPQQEL